MGAVMVMKTFIAASFAALFAGGVVYYGTEPAENGGEGVIVNDEAIEDSRASKDIISRYISDDEAGAEEVVDLEETDNPYEVESERVEFVGAEDHPHPPKNLKEDEEEAEVSEIEVSEPEVVETGQVELIEPEDNIPPAEMDEPEIEEVPEVAEPPMQSEIIQTEEQPAKPIKRTRRPIIKDHGRADQDDPAMKRIRVVFKEAKNISQPDLRDRAYLDLADYATSKGLFKQAERAALKIQQVELRDTARSRIAMGLARFGHSADAFALIEQVEVEELRDVMRLQVIEALLGTDGRR